MEGTQAVQPTFASLAAGLELRKRGVENPILQCAVRQKSHLTH